MNNQYKNYKFFINLCYHKQDFELDAEWTFFATIHRKSPCDGIGGVVKRYVAKRSLQRPLNNQILDYKAFIELCKEEIKGITFFDISQSRMTDVRESLKIRFSKGKTIPGTRSCHHFIPLSTSKISHKLTSEDGNERFQVKMTWIKFENLGQIINSCITFNVFVIFHFYLTPGMGMWYRRNTKHFFSVCAIFLV